MTLIGIKLFIYSFKTIENSSFYSLINKDDQIIGTQFLLEEQKSIQLRNFDVDDYQFKTEIADSGYQI